MNLSPAPAIRPSTATFGVRGILALFSIVIVAYLAAAAAHIWPECFPEIIVRKSLPTATILAGSLSILTQIYRLREKRALRSSSKPVGEPFPQQ